VRAIPYDLQEPATKAFRAAVVNASQCREERVLTRVLRVRRFTKQRVCNAVSCLQMTHDQRIDGFAITQARASNQLCVV
jgi:hypothetical protein